MDYQRRALLRAKDTFPVQSDIAEVVKFCRDLRIPGELVIAFPGNSGIRSIVFIEKEQVYDVAEKVIDAT